MAARRILLAVCSLSGLVVALPEPLVEYGTISTPRSYTKTTSTIKDSPTSTCHRDTVTVTAFKTTTSTTTRTEKWTKTTTKTITSCSRSTTKTKSTSTSTGLPLPTNACLTNPLCAATGWKLEYYANPFAGYGYNESGLGPGYYISENLNPIQTTTTNTPYFPQDTPPQGLPIVYPGTTFDNGQAPYYVGWTRSDPGVTVDANNFTLVYSGLYKAPATGAFKICSLADNIVDVFFGTDGAFHCDGKPSASATHSISGGLATGGNYNNPTTCFTENLTQGFYYPIRFVQGNFQGPSALGFTITAPGANPTSDFTGLIFPASCALLQ